MAVPLALTILQRRREPRAFVCACRQGSRLEARHVLIALAASAVAIWWLSDRQRKQRAATGLGLPAADSPRGPDHDVSVRLPDGVPARHSSPAAPQPAPPIARPAAVGAPRGPSARAALGPSAPTALRPARITRIVAGDTAPSPVSPARAPSAPNLLASAPAALAEMSSPAWPWAQRAALAVRLGRPVELRRIADDMERAGLDIEAGLLTNYALLLEASQASRPRVLAEVTRLLQAAAGHRRNAPISPTRCPLTAGPERSARPRIPMPTLPVERRRRAAR